MTLLALAGLLASEPTISPPPSPSEAASSHCSAAEEAVFECRLKNGKSVALCANKPGFKKTLEGNLYYRYGRIGAVELQYPESGVSPFEAFQAERYTRPMPMATTELRLRFERGGWTYEVFHIDHCEPETLSASNPGAAEEVQCSQAAGLTVTHPGRTPLELQCTPAPESTGALFKLVFAIAQ